MTDVEKVKNQTKTIYLSDYKVPEYLADKTELSFYLGEESTKVISTVSYRKNPKSSDDTGVLTLFGEELELNALVLNGNKISVDDYTLVSGGLKLNNLTAYNEFELSITTIIYPQKNTSLEGLYQSSGNFCTQCEAEGFRKITYYLDRPDVLSKFTTHIYACLLYTSPSPRDKRQSRMPSSA